MPSNREYKGKGMKGRNYDELSGVGTSSAGVTGTTGNLNDHGRDGGIGTPDLADSGNLQRDPGQPGGTPALGDSRRGQARQGTAQGGNAQGGDRGTQQSDSQADRLRGTDGDREIAERQANLDRTGKAGAADQD